MRKLLLLAIIQVLLIWQFYFVMPTYFGGVLGFLIAGIIANLIGRGLK
jgi:hypothetical protein